ncbi:MAG: thioredoxin [Candidatus Anstonellales archaeon]
MLELNLGNFEVAIKNSKVPVLVDFWAAWCGPCRMLAPVFEKVSQDYSGKVQFAKVNVDENQELAEDFGIMGIPTLILFENGKEKARISGALPEDELKEWIKENLG